MSDLFKLLVGAAIGLGALALAGAVIYNWDKIANTVSDWLRRNNLSKSILMSVLVAFDKLASGIRRKVIVKTKNYKEEVVEDVSFNDLEALKKEDYEVYEQLQRMGYVEKDITNKVMSSIH